MEENQISMPLIEANGEFGGNDVNMTESTPLSPKNSLPETTSNLLSETYQTSFTFELHTSQEIDAAIAQLGVPLAKLSSTPEETSRIIKAVTERRDQTSNNIAQPATAAAKDTGTKPKQPTKRKSSPDTQLDNTRARRSTDKDGLTAPPRHLIARGTHYMPTPPDSKQDSTTNSFSSLTNMTNSEMADDADPPEQPPRRQRISPFFIRCTKDWGSILPQLKTISPTLSSVLSRGNFLKITVASEVEHVRMKNKLVHLGLEFKCFNLKQDRPVKVMIRGLPACTPKEDINFALSHLGFKILAVNQLLKGLSHFYAEFQTIPPTPTLLPAEQTIKRRPSLDHKRRPSLDHKRRPPLELKMHRLANLRSSSLNCS
ncbi:RNA-directed DNA polymerase from mobile element jockey [Caerostris extrusa]|uniref:RNA-directed DNA polymerase from mobile element jockey n=1 Tax=Caerostris extrusa TaxID=172846 RepID=A0AAV4Q3F7_CAEEX|nr:RNA-directed DNA polymerase from mobile element jockey [Caerostris extrusa]